MISKSGLSINTFYEKNQFEASRLVFDMFFDVYDQHDVLDASRRLMLHLRWRDHRSFWSDYHGIKRWPMAGLSMKRP